MTSVEYHWVTIFHPLSPPPFSTPEWLVKEYRLQVAQYTDSSTAIQQTTRSRWYRRSIQKLSQPGLSLGVVDGAYPSGDQSHTSGWAVSAIHDLLWSHWWAVNLVTELLLETPRYYSHHVLHSAASWEGDTQTRIPKLGSSLKDFRFQSKYPELDSQKSMMWTIFPSISNNGSMMW